MKAKDLRVGERYAFSKERERISVREGLDGFDQPRGEGVPFVVMGTYEGQQMVHLRPSGISYESWVFEASLMHVFRFPEDRIGWRTDGVSSVPPVGRGYSQVKGEGGEPAPGLLAFANAGKFLCSEADFHVAAERQRERDERARVMRAARGRLERFDDESAEVVRALLGGQVPWVYGARPLLMAVRFVLEADVDKVRAALADRDALREVLEGEVRDDLQ